jgi:serine/threonine protein kinase
VDSCTAHLASLPECAFRRSYPREEPYALKAPVRICAGGRQRWPSLPQQLIEGPTLAERIKEGQIPLEEALAIAKQIANALEAAHEKSIVHRDLKPANIKIKPDGQVKVLDFGLAKSGGYTEAVQKPLRGYMR